MPLDRLIVCEAEAEALNLLDSLGRLGYQIEGLSVHLPGLAVCLERDDPRDLNSISDVRADCFGVRRIE